MFLNRRFDSIDIVVFVQMATAIGHMNTDYVTSMIM